MLCKFFCVYRPYKESISKEMNNDNDLNLHSMTKSSGWLRYCVKVAVDWASDSASESAADWASDSTHFSRLKVHFVEHYF